MIIDHKLVADGIHYFANSPDARKCENCPIVSHCDGPSLDNDVLKALDGMLAMPPLVIKPVIYVPVELVPEIEGGPRGDNGIGSTGR